MTKALTIYQPWASFVMAGAKPFEFRGWDYTARYPSILGTRIVIHASARPIKPGEMLALYDEIRKGESSLKAAIAKPILERLLAAHKCQGVLELSAGLGTVEIGKPRRVGDIFKGYRDSDRLNHHLFGWPLTDIEHFPEPIHRRGLQGFWNWDQGEPSADDVRGIFKE